MADLDLLDNLDLPEFDVPSVIVYERWLASLLNPLAASLAGYVRERQEGAPSSLSGVHHLLSTAWDASQIILREDSRYQIQPELAEYIAAQQPTASPAELYAGYLAKLREQPRNQRPVNKLVTDTLIEKFADPVAEDILDDLITVLWTRDAIDEMGEEEFVYRYDEEGNQVGNPIPILDTLTATQRAIYDDLERQHTIR